MAERSELTLNCCIRGKANVFGVKVQADATVHDLKKCIKKEAQLDSKIPTISLKLYQVSISLDDESQSLAHLTLEGRQLLMGYEKLFELFSTLDADSDTLDIIVDAPILSFVCWLQGDAPHQKIVIEVPAAKHVQFLKEKVKEAYSPTFRNTAVYLIKLYKVVLPTRGLAESLNSLEYGQPLYNPETLSTVFKDVPLLGHLHIVIERPGSRSVSSTLTSISQEDSDGGLQDDLGVFGSSQIQRFIRDSGYDTTFRAALSDDVAVATSEKGGSVYLKYADNRSKEVEILQRLQKIDSPQNHTISIIHSWEVQGGTVISMRNAGGWLTSLKHDGEQQLWQVARQLFEAIGFLHENGVAHMDIKPQNVIIPPEGGKLTIIDFSCSVRVDRPNHMFKGVAGTEGYIAPEVRVGKYSPMLADLWSCGKTLEDLCLCRTRTAPSVECTILLKMAEELMAAEPRQRPKMSDLLDRMKEEEERGTVKIQKSEENVETMEDAESVESVESMNSVESVESTESMEDMESTDRMSYPEPSSISSVSVQPIPLCATVQA